MTGQENRPREANSGAAQTAWTATATIPDAEVLAVALDRRGVRTVTVACPYCGRTHTHGWPEGEDAPGVRLAHCGPRRTPWRNPAPTSPVPREYRIGATS